MSDFTIMCNNCWGKLFEAYGNILSCKNCSHSMMIPSKEKKADRVKKLQEE